MSKLNKRSICVVAIVFMLICLAIFMRNLWRFVDISENAEFITGLLRSIIYICLFSAWAYSVRQRIIQTQARNYLTIIAVLMIFWVLLRTLKYNYFNDMDIGRYLWYLYYLPMLFIPILALCIAVSLGKSEKFRLPDWSNILFIVSITLLVLVLTNDEHQLVFGFPNGLRHYNNSEYTHRVIYYVIMGWISFCCISAFGFIIAKCRVPYSKKLIYLPAIPLVMIVVYAILYLVAPAFIKIIAGDMTVAICLLTTLSFEACIQSGLIQSNTHYNELFKYSDLRTRITDDDYNILLSSGNAEPLSKEIMEQTEEEPVMIGEGLRLCGAPIKTGHVIWLEDISEISEVISELADNSEYLTTQRSILHKEIETRKEEQRLTEQNRLYNRLMNDNQEKYQLFNSLLNQLEATNDTEKEKKLTAKLAVVCTHIKRRGNLLFIAKKMTR